MRADLVRTLFGTRPAIAFLHADAKRTLRGRIKRGLAVNRSRLRRLSHRLRQPRSGGSARSLAA